MANILIVDQESRLHEALSSVLKPMGHEVKSVYDAASATKEYKKAKADIVILEAELKGIELLRQIRQIEANAAVIMTTGLPRKEVAIDALRAGAFDLLLKPLNVKDFVASINRALSAGETKIAPVAQAQETESSPDFQLSLVGNSNKADTLRKQLRSARDSKIRAPILLQGPLGSGKRELAQYLHAVKGGKAADYCEIDCKRTDHGELRSRLFDADGGPGPVFSEYSGGTILFERIECMPEALQEDLATVAKAASKDVLWVCCSDIDLDEALADGEFSMKLYFQISGKVIDVPALKERKDDIADLISAILKNSPSVPEACRSAEFSEEAIELLQKYDWPENVLELERTVAMLAMESKGERVEASNVRRKFPAAS